MSYDSCRAPGRAPRTECRSTGPVDGGTLPADFVGRVTNHVPIIFNTARARNLVDAAIFSIPLSDLNRAIYWIGHVRGWRGRNKINVGDIVQKTGRTTGFTSAASRRYAQRLRSTMAVWERPGLLIRS